MARRAGKARRMRSRDRDSRRGRLDCRRMHRQRLPDEPLPRAILRGARGDEPVAIARFPTGLQHYVYDCRLANGGQAVVRIADARNRAVMLAAAQCSDLLRPLGVPLPEIMARGLAEDLAYLVLARLPG